MNDSVPGSVTVDLRLIAAVQIWQANVGRSRYLALVGSSGVSPLYLGT